MLKIKWLIFLCTIHNATLIYTNNTTITKTQIHEHFIQPRIENSKYFNWRNGDRFSHILDGLRMFLAAKTSLKNYYNDNPSAWVQRDTVKKSSVPMQIQWIGHASFLIQVNGFNLLTDPIFFDINRFLYPRKTPVGINPKKLPHIDFVIISHNHRDHLDEPSMRLLKKYQPIMLVPQGNKQWFIDRGFNHVIEHVWWQETHFQRNGASIEFTFVPAVHWSGRGPFDVHHALWGGWIIKGNNKTTYFAGDTGYNTAIFKAIAHYAKTIDCALLPIGPCEPRSLMCHSHMSPEDVIKVFNTLQPNQVVPMHWGTFGMGLDSFCDPIKRLTTAWKKKISADEQHKLYTIKFGERIAV